MRAKSSFPRKQAERMRRIAMRAPPKLRDGLLAAAAEYDNLAVESEDLIQFSPSN
jgi:hypothetical protein